MKRKINREGQPCRHCQTPVVKRSHDAPSKYGQKYWYKYWFQCPNCKALYVVEKAKVIVDREKIRLGADRMCYLSEGMEGLRTRHEMQRAKQGYYDDYDTDAEFNMFQKAMEAS